MSDVSEDGDEEFESEQLEEEISKRAIRNATMTQDELTAERNRYDHLMTLTNEKRLEILTAFKESEPGLWEAEGGDKLLDFEILEEEAALRILRLEFVSSRSMTKGAGGADVASVKGEMEGKEGIPPDQRCVAFSASTPILAPRGLDSRVGHKHQTAKAALTLPSALQRILLHVAFPGAAHRHRIALDKPNAGAHRLAVAATVSRAWREAVKSPGCNTAWELATRLRWPSISKRLSVASWRALYRSRAQSAPTDENAIEDLGGCGQRPDDHRPRLRFTCPIPLTEIEIRSESHKYCHVCRKTIHIVSKQGLGPSGGQPRCISYQQ